MLRSAFVAISLACATPTFAGQVDFSTVLVAQDGKPKMECVKLNSDRSKCEDEITVTLGWLSRIALDMPEDKLAITEIIKRGALAEKIAATDKIELGVDDAKLLKDQIVKVNYSTFIKFQAIRLIDPQGVK